MNTGIDGGMNKVFAAKIPDGNTGLSESAEGQSLSLLEMSKAPGTIPSTVNPPKPDLSAAAVRPEGPVVAVAAPAPNAHTASVPSTGRSEGGGFFSGFAGKAGTGKAGTGTAGATAAASPPAAPRPSDGKAAARSEPPKSIVAAKPAYPKPPVAASRTAETIVDGQHDGRRQKYRQ
jgi:hypothetical protein